MFLILNLVLSCLVIQSSQVDIIITSNSLNMFHRAICPRQPPGICCSLPLEFSGSVTPTITFRHLLPGDIAAVFWEVLDWHFIGKDTWPPNNLSPGCQTPIIQTGRGPGTYSYDGMDALGHETPIGGGSYISLGDVKLPPKPEAVSALTFQGVVGLVWGGGQWFGSAAAQSKFGLRRLKERRGIRSPQKGTAFIQGPRRWVYPTLLEMNGTQYTSNDTSRLIYTAANGQTLNLTRPEPT